jgi:hypothetical protein
MPSVLRDLLIDSRAQMTDAPSLIKWAQKEFAFTCDIPENVNKRSWLYDTLFDRILCALSCEPQSVAAEDTMLSHAQLCRIYDSRNTQPQRYRMAKEIADVRALFTANPAGFKLPLPTTVAQTLTLRPSESLLDYLARFNARCPSEYRIRTANKAKQQVLALTEQVKTLTEQLTDEKSRQPGLRQAFISQASQQRTWDYASAQSAFLEQRPSLDEGLRSLKDSADVLLESDAASIARHGVASRTTSLKFMRANNLHARRHRALLMASKPLIGSLDACKVRGINLLATTVSTYLPEPENCVLRLPLEMVFLTGSTASDYDLALKGAFADAKIDERRAIRLNSDGSPTNIGTKTGALQRHRERTGSLLTQSGVCNDHTVTLAWNGGLIRMAGRDEQKYSRTLSK